jgi:hypothetical protein
VVCHRSRLFRFTNPWEGRSVARKAKKALTKQTDLVADQGTVS